MTFVFEDGPFGRVTEAIRDIPDKRLDILETFKEQHEALLEVVLATADLQRTLQAFYEFSSRVNKMVDKKDLLEEHLQRKIQKIN